MFSFKGLDLSWRFGTDPSPGPGASPRGHVELLLGIRPHHGGSTWRRDRRSARIRGPVGGFGGGESGSRVESRSWEFSAPVWRGTLGSSSSSPVSGVELPTFGRSPLLDARADRLGASRSITCSIPLEPCRMPARFRTSDPTKEYNMDGLGALSNPHGQILSILSKSI